MPARLFLDHAIEAHTSLTLPSGTARHVQVLRLQPGDALVLFNGQGGEWQATVRQMGRSAVVVDVGAHDAADRELPQRVTLAVGMPANERMDTLVEKATELGVAVLQPLLCERSVLRLSGERAERRQAHWQGVAVAACEQSGRTRVPEVAPIRTLAEWLAGSPLQAGEAGIVLHPHTDKAPSLPRGPAVFLSGPEGGFSERELEMAQGAGFQPLRLGARVLRADTAPLAVLARLALDGL
jgi:16S rRNA (uracil1498-N3)-methyltransferase